MNKLLPYQQIPKAIGFSVAIMSVPHGQGGAFSNEVNTFILYFELLYTSLLVA